MRRQLLCSALVGGCMAGCTLLVDTSGLAGARDEADVGPETCAADGCAPLAADGSHESAAETGFTDGAATLPCPSFAIFCEDFEEGTFDKFSGVAKTNSGSVTIVTSPVHAGARSLRAFSGINAAVDASVPSSAASANAPLGQAKASGLVAVRAYIYMPKVLAGSTTILKLAAAAGDDINVKVQPSGLLSVDTDTAGSGPDRIASRGPPLATWFCLEWRITIGQGGHHTLILDGTTILDTDEDTLTPVGYDELRVGFAAAAGSSTHEVFYDDLAIATQPLPCR